MSSLHDSRLGDFTRGGQVTLHFLRMTGQVVKKFAGALIILYMMLTAGIWYTTTDPYHRYIGWRYATAHAGVFYGNGDNPTPFKQADGTYINATIRSLAQSESMKQITIGLGYKWVWSMLYSIGTTTALLFVIFFWLLKFGKSQRDEELLRGAAIVEVPEINRILRREKRASALKVAGVPLLKDSERQHVLLNGSSGTGKSRTLYELMRIIRARGDRAITFSPSGDFIEQCFRDGDTVLNPFDARCPTWDLWAECTEPYHFDMIAAAMIPDNNKGDPFWNNAARTLVASILDAMHQRDNHDLQDFMNILTKLGLESLHSYLKGTEAVALIDPASEKTAVSIRTTAATYARSFRYVPPDGEQFRIRDWVANDKGKDWIYLMAKPDQIASTRSLLSAWLEVFTNALMSLPASQSRRIWLILDELPSLNKIPSLDNFLAQARKYGGCAVLSFQQFSQLRDRYGKDGAETLAGLCATWVCMRQNDPETAKWVAQSFGEAEISEMQQGLSYGAHEIRDGVSLNAQRKKRELLLPSEIAQLNDLEGNVRLPGDVPVTHFKMKYVASEPKAEPFQPRRMTVPLETEDPLADDGVIEDFDPIEPLEAAEDQPPVARERAQVVPINSDVEAPKKPPSSDGPGSQRSFGDFE